MSALDDKNPPEQMWVIDPTQNLKEALGFLKDWVTTFLTLQTSVIAALAAFVGVQKADDFAHLNCLQAVSLIVAGASSLVSIISGLYLLNMLPAAAQMKPDPEKPAKPKDLFSIATQTDGHTIKYMADWFRLSFLAAIVALIVFIGLKLVPIL